jgi:hypothetical protein
MSLSYLDHKKKEEIITMSDEIVILSMKEGKKKRKISFS